MGCGISSVTFNHIFSAKYTLEVVQWCYKCCDVNGLLFVLHWDCTGDIRLLCWGIMTNEE